MTIIDAIHDPGLFRGLFKRGLDSWQNWRVVLKAIFGIEMTDEEQAIYRQLTGRETTPAIPITEAWLIFGRRSGKSFVVALITAFLSCFKDYRPYLAPGERGIIMIVAVDRKQARVIMRYLTAILHTVPMLAAMIQRQDAESIDLDNSISIEIMTGNFRTIRGRTVVAFLGDEAAFWRSEDSANPDAEILASVRPAMSTIPTALLLCIGSPYRRAGVMYDAYKRHYEQADSDVLVFNAPTRMMNPTVSQAVIDRAFEQDPANASAEYGAQFRSDVGSFLDLELIERAIEVGRRERPPQPDLQYVAFVDPSGGKHDAFTLAIAHKQRHRTPRSRQEEQDQQRLPPRVVLDVCRGIAPPFSPESVVTEFSALLKAYRCSQVVGDRYSAEWVRSAFARHGIVYKHSELTKSDLYLECLPLFAQGGVDLLDVRPLTTQLMGLERRTSRSGKDSVDHPPQGHDDYANAAAGALALCVKRVAELRVVPLIGF